ncbi:methyltransferase-like protein 17, mitochondrial [Sitophilus oryzae]|uniref:Methyltransferase-like protein 17, mitochondrial n=1 Tax=Sitophilus oryzae TaxID=7048 RepID=A0A6J2Y073_SITOR|nr:methyltransferase-like protein 17, mitochondrial [Sitophilus oryzae]
MLTNNLIKSPLRVFLRKYSKVAPKPLIITDKDVLKDIEQETYKPRRHPGVNKVKTASLPEYYIKSIENVIEDFPLKTLVEATNKLSAHLSRRFPPIEVGDYKERVKGIKEKVLNKHKDFKVECEEDERKLKQMVEDKTNSLIKKTVYNWKPIKYDVYTSLVYLLTRSAAEYAVLLKIFGEINQRDPEFVPRSFFDFGSGVGTGTWAVNNYWKNIFEYFNVDVSSDMNDLAQILLQGGRSTGNSSLKGTFYRQFLPGRGNSYDIVLSAYSLLELPSLESRMQTVLNLWNRTQKYLIIVEQGSNASFRVVNEVRDFLLQVNSNVQSCHVFSPCPHDMECPRLLANDGTPCNFEASYYSLPIGKKLEVFKEKYSYVVLKRGPRLENDNKWPRIVRPTLVRNKHSICRVCTANGKLDELIFTAKRHGKMTYHCARSSKWGDSLPLTLEYQNNKPDENE